MFYFVYERLMVSSILRTRYHCNPRDLPLGHSVFSRAQCVAALQWLV